MPIDPNIALSFKPTVALADPVDMYAKHQQIQSNALAMQKYQTESNEKNALAKMFNTAGFDLSKPEAQAAAIRAAPYIAPAIIEKYNTARSAGVTFDTQTQALADAKYKAAQLKLADSTKEVISHDTPDSVRESVAQRVAAGDLDQAHADAITSSLPKTPEEMPAWQQKTLRRMFLDVDKQLEMSTTHRDVGGAVQTIVTPKYAGGPAPVVTSTKKTASPGDVLAHGDRQVALRASNERLIPQTDAAGNINFFDRQGNLVKTAQGAGKPSGTFEKTKVLRQNAVKDLGNAITQLTEAAKDGGLIDQSTSSGAGALYDKTAGFFGNATKGAVAIGALQPVYDLVLKQVPRFEGPQSDKDTVSYNQAAGNLANPNTPKAVKKAAAQTILKLMKARKNQFISQEEAAGGGIVGEAPSSSGWGPASVVPEE